MKYEALLQKGAFLCMNAGWRMEREKEQPLTGVFTGHPKGFGFVAVDGLEEDIYISAEQVHGALHQDVAQRRKGGKGADQRDHAAGRYLSGK